MQPAEGRHNEVASLVALRSLEVLDTAHEAEFNALVQAASLACGVPISLISLVDADRQWFKANVGLPDIAETPREVSFCAHAVLGDGLFVVPDASLDPRFAHNPLVTGDPKIRFYAGAPVVVGGGHRVGTLCVIDRLPRELDASQRAILQCLAVAAGHALDGRRAPLQLQLAAASARVLDLYDNAPCGYHSIDSQGVFLYINATALSWLGCTHDELIGKRRVWEFFTPEGQAQFQQNFGRLQAEGRVEGLEFDLVPARGQTRRVSVSATSIQDAEGRFLMSRTVMFDITDLHRTREALRQLTAEQTAMLDNDLIGIVKLRDRRAVWKNRALGRIFGYEHGELLGQPSRMLYLDDERYRALGEAAYSALRSGKTYRTQLQMRRKDGTPVWIDMSGTLMPTQSDETMWLIADITPLRQAEDLRLKSIELEAENRQLHESSRLKSQFVANMSHELRTPLNAVIGFSHLLESGVIRPDSPKYLPYIQQIGASGKHLLQLIDSVLDHYKAESGRMEFHPENVDLTAVIRQVVDLLQAKCAIREVDIESSFAAEAVVVSVDPLRLKQVLLNLLSNAVKFSNKGGQVELRTVEAGPSWIRIEVEDHGIGIAEADLPRLFQRFEQLSVGATKTHEGTGIGLALVRQLVEAQGGTVGVRSTLGVGSAFYVVLPAGR